MTQTQTPREKLRAAKTKFEKAKETFAKAQEAWQKARREFTDSLSGATADTTAGDDD